MFEIHGLTTRQVKLLDIIWSCKSQDELDELISNLSEDDQTECFSLVELLHLEVIDSQVESMTRFPKVNKIIKHIKSL
jgi:hypothetical protein